MIREKLLEVMGLIVMIWLYARICRMETHEKSNDRKRGVGFDISQDTPIVKRSDE